MIEKIPYAELVNKYRGASELNKKYVKEIERLNNIIKEVREYINWRLEEHQDMYKYQMEELLEILGSDKE